MSLNPWSQISVPWIKKSLEWFTSPVLTSGLAILLIMIKRLVYLLAQIGCPNDQSWSCFCLSQEGDLKLWIIEKNFKCIKFLIIIWWLLSKRVETKLPVKLCLQKQPMTNLESFDRWQKKTTHWKILRSLEGSFLFLHFHRLSSNPGVGGFSSASFWPSCGSFGKKQVLHQLCQFSDFLKMETYWKSRPGANPMKKFQCKI